MSKFVQLNQSWVQTMTKPGFHLQMAYAGITGIIACFVGFRFTSVHVPDVGNLWVGLGFILAILLPLFLYLRERGMLYLADSILTIFWALFYYVFLFFAATLAARLGMGIRLQDSHFAQLDKLLRIDIPGLVSWSSHHWFGQLVNKCYPLLFPLMWIAVLLPILAGKIRYTRKLLTANVVAFALSLPLFALLPAIGPWYSYHLVIRPDEAEAQTNLLLLRTPGPYLYHPPAGVICFPSFHVIWAILCVQALWGFRPLRIPVSIFSGVIIFSTMSTGFHYTCDVLGGIPVAAAAILLANRLLSRELTERCFSAQSSATDPLPVCQNTPDARTALLLTSRFSFARQCDIPTPTTGRKA